MLALLVGLSAVGISGLVLWLVARRPRRKPWVDELPDSGMAEERERVSPAELKQEALRTWRESGAGAGREPRSQGSRAAGAEVLPATMDVEPTRQVTDSDIEWQVRTGNLLNAIKLYREKTGVGLREAKVAVEGMRHRMRAS